MLASAILYRATLRALDKPPTAQEKMRLHARVEETAWALSPSLLLLIEGRDVDEGIPDSPLWKDVVDTLSRA